MNRIVWKISLLSATLLALAARAQAQTTFSFTPSAATTAALGGNGANAGNNPPLVVTPTGKNTVSEAGVVEHGTEYCAEIGKHEECEQAFAECAFGEGNRFGCDLSVINRGAPNAAKTWLCDEDEEAILATCEQAVSGDMGGRRLIAGTVLPSGIAHRIQTTPQTPQVIAVDPSALRDPAVIDRILDKRPRLVAPAPQAPEQDDASGEASDELSDNKVAAAPNAEDAGEAFVQGAGCSLSPTLGASLNPWEWVLLVFGLFPALRAFRSRR